MRVSYRRNLGENVMRLRAERAFTQKRLAEDTGVSIEWISRIEQARVNPTLDVIVELATALGVSPERLLVDP